MGTQQVSIVDPDRHLEAQDQDALCVSWQSHARNNKVERRGAMVIHCERVAVAAVLTPNINHSPAHQPC